jgi:hypothetical protein
MRRITPAGKSSALVCALGFEPSAPVVTMAATEAERVFFFLAFPQKRPG